MGRIPDSKASSVDGSAWHMDKTLSKKLSSCFLLFKAGLDREQCELKTSSSMVSRCIEYGVWSG
jgi:hypothetical protein